jgi:hypothetical protein
MVGLLVGVTGSAAKLVTNRITNASNDLRFYRKSFFAKILESASQVGHE